ncbi:hypothetical protein POJ06DRAFT_146287 [Lipomyces tetrasporus]|uniref:Uncharacterized protein n=1 Tax=Lipomyces tetrasporus TaxID=54092 RepID=A0AAD7QN89_9ASCO|nr:uncharacterized protein POJ06DRAFT_146287 [Lipomyces tetrasporus]KAJ8098178.1 hypothetical protein POJ06DRAFT_146287 [Lipomyces tetrasporus]
MQAAGVTALLQLLADAKPVVLSSTMTFGTSFGLGCTCGQLLLVRLYNFRKVCLSFCHANTTISINGVWAPYGDQHMPEQFPLSLSRTELQPRAATPAAPSVGDNDKGMTQQVSI